MVKKPVAKTRGRSENEKRGQDKDGRRSQGEDGDDHNLMILGVVAVSIALITTAISIYIYHASGDIYLDRSRPGFLPDEKEVEEELKEDYSFSENSEINNETLEDYLKNYKEVFDDLDKVDEPFSEKPLSNGSLGIPEGKSAEADEE